ncbi:MAG: hypothetical protein QXJ69_01045 [Desulfurococcaceae archaeon]
MNSFEEISPTLSYIFAPTYCESMARLALEMPINMETKTRNTGQFCLGTASAYSLYLLSQ